MTRQQKVDNINKIYDILDTLTPFSEKWIEYMNLKRRALAAFYNEF